MPRIGTEKRPAVVPVRNMQRAEEVMRICNKHNWKVIVGIEPDKPENLHDLNWLLKRKKIPLPESLKNRGAACPADAHTSGEVKPLQEMETLLTVDR